MTHAMPEVMTHPVVGIDIGGTSVKALAAFAPHAERTARSDPYDSADPASLSRAISQVFAAIGAPSAPVGLCVPGAFDPVRRAVTASLNAPALIDVAIDDLIASACAGAIPVTITTDAHAAAFDFAATTPLTGRLLAVSLGAGVGACVLDGDRPLQVCGTSSGHLGQIDVTLPEDDNAPPLAPDGSAGSLEAYLGARVLAARFGSPLPDPLPLTRNDPALRALARALRIAHAIYRPHHIALLGGIGLRLHSHLAALRTRIDDRLTTLARPGWSLMCARDPWHAARGAARLAHKSMHAPPHNCAD
ncbi:MAG: ROK family protein [Phycisphaeraceae bacterium]|nr:ROK family protein [Phycisphaeraceae bacterium]